MKTILRIVSSFIVLMLITGNVFAQNDVEKRHYKPRENKVESTHGIAGALEFYSAIRNNPATGTVSPEEIQQAHKQADQLPKGKAMNWQEIGPDNMGGRTRALLIDKNDNTTLYAGGVAGGLWKSESSGSSWIQIFEMAENYAVSSITQDVNGIIYFGTGEGFANIVGTGVSSPGFPGGGIYKSTDATGTSFTQLTATLPSSYSDKWAYIYEMAADPTTAKVYACTNGGLYMTSDGGTTWENPVIYPSTNPYTATSHDVAVASNGAVYAVVGDKVFYSPNGAVGSFEDRSIAGLSASTIGRLEIAVAPSNPSVVYAAVAKYTGSLINVYKSTAAGQNWTIIGPGGSANFNVFGDNNQGMWNNTITVHPTNADKIFFGGIDLWEWEEGGTWLQKSLWFLDPSSVYYLHADHHDLVYDVTNPSIFYHASDGGISRTTDGGNTFNVMNRKYGTIQFYNITANCFDQVMGGTQDNGTLVIPGNLTTEGTAFEFIGGDGGWTSMSYLDPNLIVGTIYYGDAYRSNEFGNAPQTIWDDRVLSIAQDASGNWQSNFSGFVTPMILDEQVNDLNSPDSVYFYADSVNYNAGDTVYVTSNTADYPFSMILPVGVNAYDSLLVQDRAQSRFYVGVRNAVWMTKKLHDFSGAPEWWKIAVINGTSQSMAVSSCGNYLFVGTMSGYLYRISNLALVKDSLDADLQYPTSGTSNPFCIIETQQIYSAGRAITSISVDPNDASRVLITVGEYGNSQYVFMSTNALDQSPTFSNKTGDLPRNPVYGSIIEVNNPNTVIVGTEIGVYSTDNISAASPSWTENNDGLGRFPVFTVKQQTWNYPNNNNFGMIYLGTHGRGAFKSAMYVGVEEIEGNDDVQTLNIYPNPASELTSIEYYADNKADGQINIYNLEGKIVLTRIVDVHSGLNKFDINISELPEANYMIELRVNDISVSGQLIKL
ncbi:MAG: hypothetical protein C0592_08045 [Marinilabiliales bacterium]|nr:MAG: hypothetical protein C0592_08045 [Marinilabiliales bacterium]